MNPNPHPIAKIFAPIVFSTLALLTVGMAFTPAQADQPEAVAAAASAAPDTDRAN